LIEMILLASAVALLETTLATEEMSAPTMLVALAIPAAIFLLAEATLLFAASRADCFASWGVGAAAARAKRAENAYPVFMMNNVE
jgi:hypothetical protein